MNKVKHDNFLRISDSRKEKLITLFKQLENLDNTSFYEFDKEEVERLFKEIEAACVRSKKHLLSSIKDKKCEM